MITIIKDEIIKVLKMLDQNDWVRSEIIFQFAPMINKGYKYIPTFWSESGEKIRIIPMFDESFQNLIYSLIVKYNQDELYNQVKFNTTKEDYSNASIEITYNQEVEDNFRNNLPKSWQKKTIIPWWKNPEEVKGLL